MRILHNKIIQLSSRGRFIASVHSRLIGHHRHQPKKSPSHAVGARVVRSGGVGLYGRPVALDSWPASLTLTAERTTIKDSAGEGKKYSSVPSSRATARDRPYYTRPGEPPHSSCIVGAIPCGRPAALHFLYLSPAESQGPPRRSTPPRPYGM